ncbi:Protein trichome berefringence-like 7 [Linum perenne]
MAHGFNPTPVDHLSSFCKRVFLWWKAMVKTHLGFKMFQSFNGVLAVGSSLSFLLVMSYVYSFLSPRVQQPVYLSSYDIPMSNSSVSDCNLFEGSWIRDESYPLYNSSLCPFAERGFNCLANGRRDKGYTQLRWKPNDCAIPKFNAHQVLEKLRGKRIVFVGDSLSRTQWQSLICILMTGVDDRRDVYEVNGNKITKRIRFLGIRFSSFNLRIDFYRSVYLVQTGSVPRRAPKRVKSTLKLDKMDDISNEWIDSDVLIFNSGHWWTPSKLFDMGCYFQVGRSLKLGMPINTGFQVALETWATWAASNINTKRTTVFFRTFESSHWSGKGFGSCTVTEEPLMEARGKDRNEMSDIILKVAKKATLPVTALHVTPMCAYRSDAHVSTWSDNPSVPDCSHWCLPGVPDTWNELLLSYILPSNH